MDEEVKKDAEEEMNCILDLLEIRSGLCECGCTCKA